MSPPPATGTSCGATRPAPAGSGNRFSSVSPPLPLLTLCPACRYNNKPWGDCDPLLLLRTKHVTLVKDSRFSHEDCLETREFSQTCTREDLTAGIKTFDEYTDLNTELLSKEAGS